MSRVLSAAERGPVMASAAAPAVRGVSVDPRDEDHPLSPSRSGIEPAQDRSRLRPIDSSLRSAQDHKRHFLEGPQAALGGGERKGHVIPALSYDVIQVPRSHVNPQYFVRAMHT